MNYILFDEPTLRTNLLPLTFTRPIAEIRCGIRTITEKWADFLGETPSFLTQDYLQAKYQLIAEEDNIFINGAFFPDQKLVDTILRLPLNTGLFFEKNLIAFRGKNLDFAPKNSQQLTEKQSFLANLPAIFIENSSQISADFQRISSQKTSQIITDKYTMVYNQSQVFVEEGATLKACILNAENGPIYIGKNAQVQEGAVVQGPFALGEESVLNIGAKIRPGVSIGPGSKVGGEVSMSVFQGYANKAHDGYLGCSVIGEWCNLGANTNCSNLKNDWTNVKLYNYDSQQLEDTGKQFVGLFMGDFTKVGISTMFNTGTIVGVSANVFGAGFQDKFIPSFSWGGADTKIETYRFDKALAVAKATMARRKISMTDAEAKILEVIATLDIQPNV